MTRFPVSLERAAALRLGLVRPVAVAGRNVLVFPTLASDRS